jgi:hypothetical protein
MYIDASAPRRWPWVWAKCCHCCGVKRRVIDCLARKLQLDPEDLRLHLVVELTITAFSVSGRHWVHNGGQGGRAALLDGFDEAVRAIPASLHLSASA